MSSEPLLDIVPIMKREQDGAIITQFDYPMCEALGLVKMDFLGLRNLTVLDDAVDNIKANRERRPRARGSSVRRSRRPTRCSAAATRSACSSSTAARCASCCGPCSPTTSRTSPRSSRSTGRARWVPTATPTTPSARPASSRSTPIHPELAEPLDAILGTTYGLIVYQEQVMQIAQELAGFTLGQADNLRRAMGKKKKPRSSQQEYEPASRRHGRARLSRRRPSRRCGTSSCRSPTTPSTRRTRRRTACCRTGRPTSRPTTRPSSWPPCSPASRATRTSRPSTSTSAAGSASRCCRPTSTSRRPTSRPSATTSASVCRPSATSARTWWPASWPAREEGGPYTDFTDFLDKVPAHVCNKRVLDSLIKAGAFDSLGHQRRALATIAEDAVDLYIDLKRNAAIGQDSLFGGMDDGAHRRHGHRPDRCRSGRRRSCWRSSATCSASTSPTTRCSGSSTCSGQQRLHDRSAGHRHRTPRRQHRAHLRAHHRRCSASSAARATPGPRSPSRTSRVRSTCWCSPAPTSSPRRRSCPTPSWSSRAGCAAPTTASTSTRSTSRCRR